MGNFLHAIVVDLLFLTLICGFSCSEYGEFWWVFVVFDQNYGNKLNTRE